MVVNYLHVYMQLLPKHRLVNGIQAWSIMIFWEFTDCWVTLQTTVFSVHQIWSPHSVLGGCTFNDCVILNGPCHFAMDDNSLDLIVLSKKEYIKNEIWTKTHIFMISNFVNSFQVITHVQRIDIISWRSLRWWPFQKAPL